MWCTHLLGLMRFHAESVPDPATALAAINRQVCGLRSGPPITSLFLARLDWTAGELVYCNAGHHPPFVLRAHEVVEPLETGGPVLGVIADASFENGRITLQPGDTLLGYSDGLVDCRDESGEEFGISRLLGETLRWRGASASATLFSVVGAVQDFAGSQPREDDFTLMVVQHLALQ
jgi:serine phosphatase RsbU (regulator of sigma subunit)